MVGICIKGYLLFTYNYNTYRTITINNNSIHSNDYIVITHNTIMDKVFKDMLIALMNML